MSKSMCCLVYCLISIFTIANVCFGVATRIPLLNGSNSNLETNFQPYRYQRLLLFFFSNHSSNNLDFFKEFLDKLFELDEYCGGENLWSKTFYNDDFRGDCEFCPMKNSFASYRSDFETFLQNNVAYTVSAGSIDSEDNYNVTSRLLRILGMLDWEDVSSTMNIISQVILVTDYATESLRLESENKTSILNDMKSKKNITFIALTSNLNSTIIHDYYPNDTWKVFDGYLNWQPERKNLICEYDAHLYTTPIPRFSDDLTLSIFLFFSADYIQETQLVDIVDLLIHLTNRRWLFPCQQYRDIYFVLNFPKNGQLSPNISCAVEDSFFFNSSVYSNYICSADTFNKWFGINGTNVTPVTTNETLTCGEYYETFFNGKFLNENSLEKNKYLLITDMPLPCNSHYISDTFNVLQKYNFYSSGAPLTVIAIDKNNNTTVFNSYEPLFPPTQLSNLYPVNDISELLPNITKNINFCLNSWPWISLSSNTTPASPHSTTFWHFIVIGVAILIAVVCTIVVFIFVKRKRTRDKAMRRLEQLKIIMKRNSSAKKIFEDEQTSPNPATNLKDIWEVSIEALEIDYKNLVGKGAFVIVYKGYLHGKAPVLDIFPRIALQQFDNCEVAIKTLPQHNVEIESERTKFQKEITMMKEIGYHVHLIGMLGCNCSTDRPILLMELAEQDLLHWLNSKNILMISNDEHEINFDKTLLSLSWQISDGMSYLSSKHYVHRNLAARNVLLNREMKAMVSDFGLCEKLDNDDEVLTVPVGRLPLKWMALESLQEQKFSLKTDIWSFGILLFEIFSLGQEPYKETSSQELTAYLLAGKRLNKPELANSRVYNVMCQCWNAEPLDRPDFAKLESYFTLMLEDSTASPGYLTATNRKETKNEITLQGLKDDADCSA